MVAAAGGAPAVNRRTPRGTPVRNSAGALTVGAANMGREIRVAFDLEDQTRAFEIATEALQDGFSGTSDELLRLIHNQLNAIESGREFNATSVEAETVLRREQAAIAAKAEDPLFARGVYCISRGLLKREIGASAQLGTWILNIPFPLVYDTIIDGETAIKDRQHEEPSLFLNIRIW